MRLTQCHRILQHLKEHGSITADEAKALYGVARLASRINDLRAQGLSIKTETVAGKNKFEEPTHYARYSLVKEGR